MNGLMHVHVMMRCHRLKVQMLLISLRLRASLRSGQVEWWRRARVERLFCRMTKMRRIQLEDRLLKPQLLTLTLFNVT